MKSGKIAIGAFSAIALFGLAGCANEMNKATVGQASGMATGAVVGGAIGKYFGGRPGMIAGAIIGTSIAGMIGYEIGRSLDEKDRVVAHQRMALGLSQGKSGQAHTWTNPDKTAKATYTPQDARPATVTTRLVRQSNVEAVGSLDLIGQTYRAQSVAEVYASPQPKSKVVTKLASSEDVMVYGQVSGQPWYVVGRNGVTVGYVQASALKPSTERSNAPSLIFQEPAAITNPANTAVSDITVNTTCRDMSYEIARNGNKVEEGTFRGCKKMDGNWAVQRDTA